ncbi:MAG TPA: hypothetical protein VH439_17490 [Gemmatimonadales bacterium]
MTIPAEQALRDALQPLWDRIPRRVADDIRAKLDAAFAPRRITTEQLRALEEGYLATAEGTRLGRELRAQLYDLLQTLRAEAGASPSGT